MEKRRITSLALSLLILLSLSLGGQDKKTDKLPGIETFMDLEAAVTPPSPATLSQGLVREIPCKA